MHGYRILGGRIPYISYIRAFFQKLAVFSLQLFDFQLFESKTHVSQKIPPIRMQFGNRFPHAFFDEQPIPGLTIGKIIY